MNISHHPDEVSTTEEDLCNNAKTSIREDTSKVTVTGTHNSGGGRLPYQDNVLVSVFNAEHDYISVSWVRYSDLYFGFNIGWCWCLG